MELICFTSSKGGVGTSHLVAKISEIMCDQGYKCLVVDLHSKRRTMDIYLCVSDAFVYDINDVVDNVCSFSDAAVKVKDNLYFMPCSQTRDICDYSVVYNILKNNSTDYDFVLIDTPYNNCSNFSKIVLVTNCDNASVRCTEKLSQDLKNSEKYLIINKINADFIESEKNMNVDDICDICGISPIGLVPYEPEYFNGEYNENFISAKACENIVKRLNNEHVCAVNINNKKAKKLFSRR